MPSSSSHNSRGFSDAFYTSPKVFKTAASWLRKHCPSAKTFFDFSAGDGAISEFLPKGVSYYGIDIHPTHARVHRADFLKTHTAADVDVVGFNPPFGRGGGLALRFVNRAITALQPTCMLLVLPAKAWDFDNTGYSVVRCQLLPRDCFWTPDTHKPFSTPAIMVLLRRHSTSRGSKAIINRNPDPVWRWSDRSALPLPRTPSETVVLLRKVGVNAGMQAYMIAATATAHAYEVTYVFRGRCVVRTCDIPSRGSLVSRGTLWKDNGHIVCDRDVVGAVSRSGLGFLKCIVALPPTQCLAQLKRLMAAFTLHNSELVTGAPPSICIGLIHFCGTMSNQLCK